MPQKEKIYEFTKFPPEVINKALDVYFESSKNVKKLGASCSRKIELNEQEAWDFDNNEEFFSEYIKNIKCKLWSWG
jgi:hypothetical protein